MKILITDSIKNSYEIDTNCKSIFEVLEDIENTNEYVTFSQYHAPSNYYYDHAIKKSQIVSVEEINDINKPFLKDNKGLRTTF